MQEFRYFVIVEKDGEIKRLNDAMFTSDDVLRAITKYPNSGAKKP